MRKSSSLLTPPFLFALLFVIGIACSKALMSLSMIGWTLWTFSQFILNKGWLHFQERTVAKLKSNPWIWLVLFYVVLHGISLAWSEDMSEGIHGTRVRLTLMIIPLLMVLTIQWTKPQLITLFSFLQYTFLLLVVINIIRYQYLIQNSDMFDIRQLSYFGSHIRFGIFFSFSVLFSYYNWKEKAVSTPFFLTYLIIVILYTIYSQVISAVLTLIVVAVSIAYLFLKTVNKGHYLVGIVAILTCLIGLALFIVFRQPPVCPSFEQPEKVAAIWSKKSTKGLNGLDDKKQPIKRTLERYLCAKKQPLTSESVFQMSAQEVSHVERGFTSMEQASGGLFSKIEEIQFQLYEAQDPNGHSLLQRFAFWNAARGAIKENLWLGVGIGDVKSALNTQYKNHSNLRPENYKRPHNMFLTTFLAVGFLGLILLVLLMVYGFYQSVIHKHILLFCFLCISILTMMFEDSLETQSGISFFSFFLALFLAHTDRNPHLKID